MYFSAAHHLLNYEGECEHQHGHNWLVEAYVKGENLDKSNILVDYKVLKREMKAVLDLLDHKDINELPEFKGESPSSEMISMFIYNNLKRKLCRFLRFLYGKRQLLAQVTMRSRFGRI